ncbi:MAG: hypothetical protein CMG00_03295 [Candidatus Marinimicrobia bacterium]|nr:hypothetical protein [Candidatus Neomarinimicrobiota bacterium]|tara:strand:+ start:2180 stop:3331 length:1152 start_codon:yes stop_codon:yes gene_type:complete
MFNIKYIFSNSVVLFCIFFLSGCDEDYISSLSNDRPIISLELLDQIDDVYFGESIDDLEVILSVRNVPAISLLAFTVEVESNFLYPDSIAEPQFDENNLFYNINPSPNIRSILNPVNNTLNPRFEINIGFENSNDEDLLNFDSDQVDYTIGDGEIARLFLSGLNGSTIFNVSIDEVISYEGDDINFNNWIIQTPITVGASVPELSFSNIVYDFEESTLEVDLNVKNLPKITESEIIIDYDSEVLSFIDDVLIEGEIIASGFDVALNSIDGSSLLFSFKYSDGNLGKYIEGEGNLTKLRFYLASDFLVDMFQNSYSSPFEFGLTFNSAIFDVCGDCGLDVISSEYFFYDTFIWDSFIEDMQFGCTNPLSDNYNSNANIDNNLCQ